MNYLKFTIIFTIINLISSMALAGGQSTGLTKITNLTTNRNAQVRVNLSKAMINPAKCPNTDFYILKINDDVSKVMFSTLLNAFSTQQNMSLFILDNACEGNNPVINAISLKY